MKVRLPPSSALSTSTKSIGRVKAGEKITMLLPKAKAGADGVGVWTWVGVAEVLTSFLAGLGGRMGGCGVVC